MKKRVLLFGVMVIVALVFTFAGCDMFGNDGDDTTTEEETTNDGDDTTGDDTTTEPELYVRFANQLLIDGDPYNLGYGVRTGDAVHNDALFYGYVSSYYKLTPGIHTIEAKNNTGSWDVVSTPYDSTGLSGRYTIVGQGDVNATFAFIWVKD